MATARRPAAVPPLLKHRCERGCDWARAPADFPVDFVVHSDTQLGDIRSSWLVSQPSQLENRETNSETRQKALEGRLESRRLGSLL